MERAVVILKLDDLRDSTYHNFHLIADYIITNNFKASFGINGKYLLNKDSKHPLIRSTTFWANTGNIEIWHHGWDHSKAEDRSWFEYKNRDYKEQFHDFKNTLDIVKELCSITMHTFGSPYNQNDKTCVDVIDQFHEMKVFLFPRTPVTEQMELSISKGSGRLDIENGETGKVDYNYFLDNYENYKSSMDYMVLQAHPGQFNRESLSIFKIICNYLRDKGHRFMTPYEFYKYKQSKDIEEKI